MYMNTSGATISGIEWDRGRRSGIHTIGDWVFRCVHCHETIDNAREGNLEHYGSDLLVVHKRCSLLYSISVSPLSNDGWWDLEQMVRALASYVRPEILARAHGSGA